MQEIKFQIKYVNSNIRKNAKLLKLNFRETFKNILNINNIYSLKSILFYEDIVSKTLEDKITSILKPKMSNLLRKVSEYYNNYDWVINISVPCNYESESFVFITIESNQEKKTTFVLLAKYIDNVSQYIKTIEDINTDNMSLELSIPRELYSSNCLKSPEHKINLPDVVYEIFNFIDEIEEKQLSPLVKKEEVSFTIHLVFNETLKWYATYFDNNYASHHLKMFPNRTFERRKNTFYESDSYPIENNNKLNLLRSMNDSGFLKIPNDILETVDEDNIIQSLEYIKVLGY